MSIGTKSYDVAGRRDRRVLDMTRPARRSPSPSVDIRFTGICYAPNGLETSGLTDGAKPWVEFNEQDWTFSEIVGPVAAPWAAYRQYRRKADLRGPWYATVSG